MIWPSAKTHHRFFHDLMVPPSFVSQPSINGADVRELGVDILLLSPPPQPPKSNQYNKRIIHKKKNNNRL